MILCEYDTQGYRALERPQRRFGDTFSQMLKRTHAASSLSRPLLALEASPLMRWRTTMHESQTRSPECDSVMKSLDAGCRSALVRLRYGERVPRHPRITVKRSNVWTANPHDPSPASHPQPALSNTFHYRGPSGSCGAATQRNALHCVASRRP